MSFELIIMSYELFLLIFSIINNKIQQTKSKTRIKRIKNTHQAIKTQLRQKHAFKSHFNSPFLNYFKSYNLNYN